MGQKSITILLLGLLGGTSQAADDFLSWEEARQLLANVTPGRLDTSVQSPSPCELLPSAGGSWVYDVVAGEKAGETSQSDFRPANDHEHPGLWQITTGDQNTLSIDTDQQLAAISSVLVVPRNLLVHYVPGEPLFGGGMQAGESTTTSIDVKVVNVNKPSETKASGTMTVVMTFLGKVVLETDAGSLDTYVFRSDIESEVGPLKENDTAYNFLAPGIGIAARITKMHRHAYLVYNKNKRDAYVLKNYNINQDVNRSGQSGVVCD